MLIWTTLPTLRVTFTYMGFVDECWLLLKIPNKLNNDISVLNGFALIYDHRIVDKYVTLMPLVFLVGLLFLTDIIIVSRL